MKKSRGSITSSLAESSDGETSGDSFIVHDEVSTSDKSCGDYEKLDKPLTPTLDGTPLEEGEIREKKETEIVSSDPVPEETKCAEVEKTEVKNSSGFFGQVFKTFSLYYQNFKVRLKFRSLPFH